MLMKMKSAPMPKSETSESAREMRKRVTRAEHWKKISSYFCLSVLPFSVRSSLPERTRMMEMLSENNPEITKVRRGVSNIIVNELSIVAMDGPAVINSNTAPIKPPMIDAHMRSIRLSPKSGFSAAPRQVNSLTTIETVAHTAKIRPSEPRVSEPTSTPMSDGQTRDGIAEIMAIPRG